MKLLFSILIAVIDTFLTARAASHDAAGSFAEESMSKLVNAAEEKLQRKQLFTPGSCWHEGDGCTVCDFTMEPLNAIWNCPDMCGPAHDFGGYIVTTDGWWPDGTYVPLVAQDCSVSGCAYPTGWPDTCYLFESDSEGGWTCQDVCEEAPTSSPTGPVCEDVPGWSDSDGDDCNFYAQDGACYVYGSCCKNDGYTANDACCVCGGGSSTGTDPCVDVPGWSDSYGDDCNFYAQDGACYLYGSCCENDGYTANDACCVCGGGVV